MEKENQEILDNLRSAWQKEQERLPKVEELHCSHARPQYIRQRRRCWGLLIGMAILLVGSVIGMIKLWPMGMIIGIVIVGLIAMMSLYGLIEAIGDLYWLYCGRPTAESTVVTKSIEHLQRREERRLRQWRFFIIPTSTTYSLRWGRVVGASMGMAILVGMSLITIPTIEPTTPMPNSISEQASVADSQPDVIVEKMEEVKSIEPAHTPQRTIAQIKTPETMKEPTPQEEPKLTTPIEEATDSTTFIENDEPIYMHIESRYNTIIRVRCNKSCVAENITGTCDDLILENN